MQFPIMPLINFILGCILGAVLYYAKEPSPKKKIEETKEFRIGTFIFLSVIIFMAFSISQDLNDIKSHLMDNQNALEVKE
jgi:uncharacterized membrane protein